MHQVSNRIGKPVALAKPPKSAKVKFTYDESTLRWRVFYGLDGAEPVTEFAESREGFYFKSPTSESLGAYIMISNGSADIDNLEIKPLK